MNTNLNQAVYIHIEKCSIGNVGKTASNKYTVKMVFRIQFKHISKHLACTHFITCLA